MKSRRQHTDISGNQRAKYKGNTQKRRGNNAKTNTSALPKQTLENRQSLPSAAEAFSASGQILPTRTVPGHTNILKIRMTIPAPAAGRYFAHMGQTPVSQRKRHEDQ
jgi:hypothetical protein